jgi:hypothetical protein
MPWGLEVAVLGGAAEDGERGFMRRLSVIDGHSLVGIVALADVARVLPTRRWAT